MTNTPAYINPDGKFINSLYDKPEGYTCEICRTHFKLRGGLSKHKNTERHKSAVLKEENFRLKLELEKFKLLNSIPTTNTTTTINNTIINNNVVNNDNSDNSMNIFISKDAINLDEMPDINWKEDPLKQIFDMILKKVDDDKRPIYIKNEITYAKNEDTWFKGGEAEDKINKWGARVQHKGIVWLNDNEKDLLNGGEKGMDEYMKINENIYKTINADAILHKNKHKLKTTLRFGCKAI